MVFIFHPAICCRFWSFLPLTGWLWVCFAAMLEVFQPEAQHPNGEAWGVWWAAFIHSETADLTTIKVLIEGDASAVRTISKKLSCIMLYGMCSNSVSWFCVPTCQVFVWKVSNSDRKWWLDKANSWCCRQDLKRSKVSRGHGSNAWSRLNSLLHHLTPHYDIESNTLNSIVDCAALSSPPPTQTCFPPLVSRLPDQVVSMFFSFSMKSWLIICFVLLPYLHVYARKQMRHMCRDLHKVLVPPKVLWMRSLP